MDLTEQDTGHGSGAAAAEGVLKEIVMGLHWHPSQPGDPAGAEPANLDAVCVVFDRDGGALEAVHPARRSNANGSILHTGDSPTGASAWDDERIFVFLDALPETAAALSFVVASANGRPFTEIAGAACHVSDRITEHEWLRLELATVGPQRACRVATLRRHSDGWRISIDTQAMEPESLAELILLPGRRQKPRIAGAT